MDTSADVAAIIKQAPDWNFAGDCALLELMKRISQNLEERGEHTINNLNAFETNVRRADIALDNATNSLRSLQFGQQFVEYRVEEVDDDDFSMPEEQLKEKPEVLSKSAQEMAKEFLQNNLQMFRKNFEPVTIEVPDSDDDEDGAVNTTTVFRAKNPYDSIPLPYIIGSKDWQDHKYAGLYDSAENSEDEQPEEFSSSSSDELEDVGGAAKPRRKMETPQQSDSSSLTSLPRDQPPSHPHPQPAPVAAPVVEAVVPAKAQPRPIISSRRNPHERDLFNALRASPPSDDPPSTSSSLNSGTGGATASRLHQHVDASLSSSSSGSNVKQSPVITVAAVAPVPVAVAAPVPTPIPTVIPASLKEETVQVTAAPAANQIKRPPVNLFNDDAFNSFMSEIVDKVQSKSGKESIKESPQLTKSLNLFDDSPPVTPKVTTTVKTLPTSIFDDNLDDDDDFLSSFASKTQSKTQPPIRKTTLFDDDDDELDINDIFKSSKPKPKAENKLLAKNWLFEDDEVEDKDMFGAEAVVQPAKEQRGREEEEKRKKEQEEKEQVVRREQERKMEQEQEERKKREQKQKEQVEKKKEQEKEERKQQEEELKKELEQRRQQEQKMEEKRKQEEKVEREKEELEKKKEQEKEERKQQEEELKKELEKRKQEENVKREKEQRQAQEQKELEQKKKQQKLEKASELKKDQEQDQKRKQQEHQVATRVQHKSLFDDLDDDDLFGTPKTKPKVFEDVQEESPKDDHDVVSKEVQETAEDQVQNNLMATQESQISVPKAELFSDDFSDDDESLKDLGKEATTEIPTDPREKDVDFKDKSDDLLGKEQLQQDPILSLVADAVNNKQRNPSGNPRKPEELLQNYSSLFSDEPPDDSEFFQSLGSSSLNSLSNSKMFEEQEQDQDFFEPSLPDLPDMPKASAEPVEDYGGLRLFSDVPPEDDGQDEPASPAPAPAESTPAVGAATKRIHTIFYDDFSETARAQSQSRPAAAADVVDRSMAKTTSPVKKLQMPNININVKALLPGAGTLPKLVRSQKREEVQQQDQLKREQEQVKSASSDADNILQCMAKTRARGPAHRRPSTRRARQENYAKSLRDEVESTSKPTIDASSSKATLGMPSKTVHLEHEQKLARNAPNSSGIATKAAPQFLESDDDDALFKPAAGPVAAPSILSTIPPVVPPIAAPVTLPPADDHESLAKTTTKTIAAFLDSDDDDENDFLFTPTTSTNPHKKYVSFLDNADEDDDKQATKSGLVNPGNAPREEQQKKKLTSSFLDSDEDNDDNSLFVAVPPEKTVREPQEEQLTKPTAAPVEVQSAAAANPSRKYVSFLDNEDEDVDVQKPPPKFNPAKIQSKSKAILASKLFDDSDDDDDLFGKANASSKVNPKSKPASLFEDSDREKETRPKVLSIKAKLPAKSSKSLFSDDEDDDDLFGGGGATKRAAVSNQAKTRPSNPVKTPAKSQPSSGKSDNPLADLLDP